jgi:hypothetical protein
MSDVLIEAADDVSKARVIHSKEDENTKLEPRDGPLGVDIGTSRIVVSQKKGNTILTKSRLNAFFTVPYFTFTQEMLEKNRVPYCVEGDSLVIIGNTAEKFSLMFNTDVRRPMQEGLLNAQEVDGQKFIQKILETLVGHPDTLGEQVCISMPAVPPGWEHRLLYHQAILKNYFMSLGYRVKTINEGLAVILTELAENFFTGVGLNLGGGMCNVCFSYLSLPILTFSVPKAGDYIDHSVAAVMNMLPTEVRVIKENELNLSQSPRNRIQNALHIFYDEVIHTMLSKLKTELSKSNKLPQVQESIPIILAGGTAMPKGFLSRFEKILPEYTFPVPIAGVRLAKDPLTTTARGALIAAMSKETPFEQML